jgi:hypothetical protein
MTGFRARMVFGAIFGLIAGPIAVAAAGFLAGGLLRMAPCHEASGFLSSAAIGAFGYVYLFGLPSMGAGSYVGAIVAAILDRWQASCRTTSLVIIGVEFVLAVIAILASLLDVFGY